MKPRPYQLEARRESWLALKTHDRSLVVMPTGTGKTVTFASIIADAVKAGRRVFVLAHREELLDQAADKIRAIAKCDVAIEQGERRQATALSPVVVACVFSIIGRLDRFPPDAFSLGIIDEAHRSLGRTYRDLLDHFARTKVLGFTATPNRGDELALAQVFDSVAYTMSPAEAVLGGWLVPTRTVTIEIDALDLSGVRRRNGDLVAGQLAAVMSMVDVMSVAVERAVDFAGSKQAIVFTCTVAHMHATATAVQLVAAKRRITLKVATVDGTTPKAERARIMADFRAKRINWLINVEVATEGFDAPTIEAVICLRPTLSRSLFEQQRGRGARPLPGVVDGVTIEDMLVKIDEMALAGRVDPDGWIGRAILGLHRGDAAAARRLAIALSDKPECLVLDFTGNSSKFSLATEMDALGGEYDLPIQRDAERLLQAGEADHLLDALERARLAAMETMRTRQARAGDPFALFDLRWQRDPYGREPTPKHRRALAPLRLPLPKMDWRQANTVASELARRADAGLCGYDQAAILARLGFPVSDLPTLTRREAAGLVRALARGGWSRPDDWAGMRRAAARLGEA